MKEIKFYDLAHEQPAANNQPLNASAADDAPQMSEEEFAALDYVNPADFASEFAYSKSAELAAQSDLPYALLELFSPEFNSLNADSQEVISQLEAMLNELREQVKFADQPGFAERMQASNERIEKVLSFGQNVAAREEAAVKLQAELIKAFGGQSGGTWAQTQELFKAKIAQKLGLQNDEIDAALAPNLRKSAAAIMNEAMDENPELAAKVQAAADAEKSAVANIYEAKAEAIAAAREAKMAMLQAKADWLAQKASEQAANGDAAAAAAQKTYEKIANDAKATMLANKQEFLSKKQEMLSQIKGDYAAKKQAAMDFKAQIIAAKSSGIAQDYAALKEQKLAALAQMREAKMAYKAEKLNKIKAAQDLDAQMYKEANDAAISAGFEGYYGHGGYGKPGYGKPGYGYGKPGYGYGKPGFGKPVADDASADASSAPSGGYYKPGYHKPDYAKPGYNKPDYAKPGYHQPDYAKPGYGKPEKITPPKLQSDVVYTAEHSAESDTAPIELLGTSAAISANAADFI